MYSGGVGINREQHRHEQQDAMRAANSVCSLPRLRGRVGEGANSTSLSTYPLPIPPPQSGEGTTSSAPPNYPCSTNENYPSNLASRSQWMTPTL
jgi:hypothetical protein